VTQSFLSPAEHRSLAAFCDTLLPRLPVEVGDDERLMGVAAADLDLAPNVEDALARAIGGKEQAQVKQFLALLELRVFNGMVAGEWQPFSRLSLEARTGVLTALATHRLALLRKAFAGIARLSLATFYSRLPDGKSHPVHPVFNYQVPSRPVPAAGRINTLDISNSRTLACDVLVVGSGAGGGVAAAELTAAGHDVLIVEKGGHLDGVDFNGRELEGQHRLYERRGALTTVDGSLLVVAGSTLGGGTTVNWSGSLRPPEDVLEQWERDYGFEGVSGPEFQRSLDAVSRRLGIDACAPEAPNANTRVFEAGLNALNYNVTRIPRNASGCRDCGFCAFGCPSGAKQGTLRTYLQDAHEQGARIVVNASVHTLVHDAGRIRGARLRIKDRAGVIREINVTCKAVVMAAGAIHTPAVLLRSGLRNPNIGRNLHLHPTVGTSALFAEPIRAWEGPPMTRLTAEFANLDSRGYGVRLMNAPSHPGVLAFATPWQSGRRHKRIMQQAEHTANIIVVTRDRQAGRITLDAAGMPQVDYKLAPYDARHMLKGIQEALRVHVAAGALAVNCPQASRPSFTPGGDESFEAFLHRVERWGLRPHDIPVFSAHQMSSARIADRASRGVADPNGETFEVKGLFIADSSALPTCSGVNPMLTVLGTAHYLAQRIKERI
jgi:choline dehydrogenase-like flavoprotein